MAVNRRGRGQSPDRGQGWLDQRACTVPRIVMRNAMG